MSACFLAIFFFFPPVPEAPARSSERGPAEAPCYFLIYLHRQKTGENIQKMYFLMSRFWVIFSSLCFYIFSKFSIMSVCWVYNQKTYIGDSPCQCVLHGRHADSYTDLKKYMTYFEHRPEKSSCYGQDEYGHFKYLPN